ncbi:unnamed protein product [Debaryomyces tyrocola]|nr:unnamed protein product [Debaryomyces tyrocola]
MARKNSKNKSSTRKRSSQKVLDAFQIAERAENRSEDDSDNRPGDEDDLEVHDGIMDASKFLANKSKDDEGLSDEELDSDEALGSDDDYDVLTSKFSQTIRDKEKKRKLNEKKRKRGEYRDSESEDEDEDEGYASIDESQLVTLSQAWDMDEKDAKSLQKSNDKNDLVLDDAWESESSEEDSEEESDEESDDEEDIFKSASENENDDEIDLANTVSQLQSQLKKPAKERKRLIAEATDENEFNLPTKGVTLSLQDMISAVDPSVSKDAILIDGEDNSKQKALATPLPKRIQERNERQIAYEITNEDISKWEDTVQQNRQAEVLNFPLNPEVKHNDTATTFRSSNEPSTELEKKIQGILKDSALTDDKKEATFEEIAAAKLSSEELKKRTNELRLMRELMFRDEKRAKRIKKIKSKTYHKIKKKERLRTQEMVEGSDMESDNEDHDMKRAKERMLLKHKTQSKWAKSMIKSGLSKDASNRDDLEEMLRQGEKLRSKQLGYEDGDQSDQDVSDIEDEYAKDDETNETDDINRNKLGKGVLAMDFMKSADKRHKQENLKELELLKKLENGGDLDEFQEDATSINVAKNQGRRVYTPNASSMKSDINEVNQKTLNELRDDESNNLENRLSEKFKVVDNSISNKKPNNLSKDVEKENKLKASDEAEDVNPWLAGNDSEEAMQKSRKIHKVDKTSSKLSKSAQKISKNKKRSASQRDDEDTIIDMHETLKAKDIHDSDNENSDDEVKDDGVMFKQKNLIKQAFAGDDVVREFEKEKRQVIKDEGDKEEDVTLPGWGDWAGGKKKPKKKIVRKIDGVVQKDKRKDKNLKDVIINEKVNKKNLKYQSSGVPFPYESREQYERALRMPVGQEWTSRETHQKLTMPRIITKQGTVIDPLKAPFK